MPVYSPISIRNNIGAMQPSFLAQIVQSFAVPRVFFVDGSAASSDGVWLGQTVPPYSHTTNGDVKQSPTACMPGQLIPIQHGPIVQVQIGWQTIGGEAINVYNVKCGDFLNTAYDQNRGWVIPFEGNLATGFTLIEAAVQALEPGQSGDIISAIILRSYFARDVS